MDVGVTETTSNIHKVLSPGILCLQAWPPPNGLCECVAIKFMTDEMTRERLSAQGFVEEQKIYIIQNDNRMFTTELFKLILIFHGLVDLL